MAPLVSGVVAIATPSQAASLAFSESLLEVTFNQAFFSSSTDTDTDTFTIADDGDVSAEAVAEAVIFNDPSDASVCIFGLGNPGACNVAFSGVIGDNGNNYFGQAKSTAKVLGNFFVSSGAIFAFDFIASLLLQTEIDRPDIETAQAAGTVSFSLYGGPQAQSLSLLDTFTLSGSLSTVGPGDSLVAPKGSHALTFDTSFDQSFGGQVEFVDAFVEGSYNRSFENDTYLQLIEVKTTTACVATAASQQDCKQSVPEPMSILALLAPLLGLMGIFLKKEHLPN
ncbi:hypothetical protein [Leptothoe sp. PORK10 BA2]|uniref:hypothetical protein n=1 Tax=Leptothoe sp. PORK10 BA2 TaxID=3110254 RepID=UPI002B1F15E3|nr:hypothetical protein [Leptothoe sp. PORK10 BA2]